jgi:UDP-N-acetylglucosamine pyrophosphorylase
MYDIDLPSHRTLFQYQAARIKSLEALAAAEAGKPVNDVHIRWYVMTSGPTRVETEAYFEKNGFFGLDPADVIFFEQGEYIVFPSSMRPACGGYSAAWRDKAVPFPRHTRQIGHFPL